MNETCDKCGPAVKAAVKVESGLTWCAHCHRAYGGTVVNVVTEYDVTTGYITDNFKVPDQAPVSDGACTADPPEYESSI
jgi:hypothetical protein